VTGLHGGSDEVDVDLDVDLFNYAPESVSPAQHQQHVPVGIDGPRLGDIIRAPRELLLILERTMHERYERAHRRHA
jgi:hypothetical protein